MTFDPYLCATWECVIGPQIRVDGIPPAAQSALLYETVEVVEGTPILRDMVFSPDHQHIYLHTHTQVCTHTHTYHIPI